MQPDDVVQYACDTLAWFRHLRAESEKHSTPQSVEAKRLKAESAAAKAAVIIAEAQAEIAEMHSERKREIDAAVEECRKQMADEFTSKEVTLAKEAETKLRQELAAATQKAKIAADNFRRDLEIAESKSAAVLAAFKQQSAQREKASETQHSESIAQHQAAVDEARRREAEAIKQLQLKEAHIERLESEVTGTRGGGRPRLLDACAGRESDVTGAIGGRRWRWKWRRRSAGTVRGYAVQVARRHRKRGLASNWSCGAEQEDASVGVWHWHCKRASALEKRSSAGTAGLGAVADLQGL